MLPLILELLACCCMVLMVSNGARRALEHPAANADAAEFLMPFMVADDFNLGMEDSEAPPLEVLVDALVRVRVRVRVVRSVEELTAEALTLIPPLLLTRITPIPSKDKIRIILFITEVQCVALVSVRSLVTVGKLLYVGRCRFRLRRSSSRKVGG